MKRTLYFTILLAAMAAGFWVGYKLTGPLVATLLLLWSEEPSTNLQLYNEFLNSPSMMLFSMAGAALVAGLTGTLAENLLKRAGFLDPDLAEEQIEFTIHGQVEVVPETASAEAESAEAQVSDQQLFAGKVSAQQLSDIVNGESDRPLIIRQTDGSALVLQHAKERPLYEERSAQSDSMLVTLRQGRRVDHSFETIVPGGFTAPEGKPHAYCTYQLRYLGCEEATVAILVFKGERATIRSIFLRA
jgi:hypothetical protein